MSETFYWLGPISGSIPVSCVEMVVPRQYGPLHPRYCGLALFTDPTLQGVLTQTPPFTISLAFGLYKVSLNQDLEWREVEVGVDSIFKHFKFMKPAAGSVHFPASDDAHVDEDTGLHFASLADAVPPLFQEVEPAFVAVVYMPMEFSEFAPCNSAPSPPAWLHGFLTAIDWPLRSCRSGAAAVMVELLSRYLMVSGNMPSCASDLPPDVLPLVWHCLEAVWECPSSRMEDILAARAAMQVLFPVSECAVDTAL